MVDVTRRGFIGGLIASAALASTAVSAVAAIARQNPSDFIRVEDGFAPGETYTVSAYVKEGDQPWRRVFYQTQADEDGRLLISLRRLTGMDSVEGYKHVNLGGMVPGQWRLADGEVRLYDMMVERGDAAMPFIRTSGPKSLNVEPQSTNLLVRSSAFDAMRWQTAAAL